MKLLLLVSSLATLAVAAPAPQRLERAAKGAYDLPGACKYSAFEKSNLGHNHDVNTGKIKYGKDIKSGAPALNGAGCSPAWAVGGRIDDNTPTVTPSDQRKNGLRGTWAVIKFSRIRYPRLGRSQLSVNKHIECSHARGQVIVGV